MSRGHRRLLHSNGLPIQLGCWLASPKSLRQPELAAPDVRDGLAKIGVTVQAMSGQEFVKFLQREDVKWAKAVKDSGAKLE